MEKTKFSILIVDDELELLEMYKECFESDGFKVQVAASGPEAIEVYRNNQDIKVILSDSNMGEMTGVQFLMKLKSDYQTIPMFYLATGALEHSEAYIKSIGAHSLVLKPFDLDEIIIKIKNDLNR